MDISLVFVKSHYSLTICYLPSPRYLKMLKSYALNTSHVNYLQKDPTKIPFSANPCSHHSTSSDSYMPIISTANLMEHPTTWGEGTHPPS